MTRKLLLAFAAIASVLIASPAMSAPHDGKPAKSRATVTVKKWRGYGFLPGYPRSERERQRNKWLSERRYFGWNGNVYYGFGRPGFYRGQWNGGSFGPCWTSTPIGMQWNCGM